MRLPKRGRRARWLAIGYGLLLFVWLTPEDNSVVPVTLLGAGLSVLLVIYWVLGKWGGSSIAERYVVPGVVLLGAAAGLGTSITTFSLMLVKNVQHSHIYIDFPPGLMLAILARAPLWALAGGLLGLGLTLAWLALVPQQPAREE